MADTERSEFAQKDLDVLIAEARSSGDLNPRAALTLLVEKLKVSEGYYKWSPLGADALAVWQFRTPREDLPDEAWLKEEDADLLHLCRPVKFLEAVERRDKEGSSDYVGYIRDEDGKVADHDTLRCTKCKREMPSKEAKKGAVQLAMHRLGRKR